MKLLRCTACRDVVRLLPKLRSCACGRASGFVADQGTVLHGDVAVALDIPRRMLDLARIGATGGGRVLRVLG